MAGGAGEVDTAIVAVDGASAGANLAMALALSMPSGTFAGLVLFHGVFGSDLETASYGRYAEGPGLSRARMAELFDLYDPGALRGADPLIAPLLSDRLDGLPPACLIAAEHDVLRDDSRALAERLSAAGVGTRFHIAPGVTHGFINRGRVLPAARDSIRRAGAFLETMRETSAR